MFIRLIGPDCRDLHILLLLLFVLLLPTLLMLGGHDFGSDWILRPAFALFVRSLAIL